jgi:leucyl-tRNA synthetase
MSKSRGNVVSPDDMISRFGADSTRMYALFAAPPDRDLDWQEDGVAGVSRFLGRTWRLVTRYAAGNPAAAQSLDSALEHKLVRKLHQTIRRVTDEFNGRWHFNICVAAVMELVNDLTAAEAKLSAGALSNAALQGILRDLVLLLAPFAPYLAAELWEKLGNTSLILRAPWPKYDPALAAEDELEIPVQVNGKLRGKIRIAPGTAEEKVRDAALHDEKTAAALAGREVVKVIIVPDKLVNFVVK